eukprot:TRINITY_DN33065_c0_g1_i1.p1 TRINITY_DN33065_c0_g1~~TRINITY_DN33065_c0_g1_i1.p1  ORF type:complete len:623 (-),score=236.77 TRINITY_DN33065_c0_g1_i1:72-1940(-)
MFLRAVKLSSFGGLLSTAFISRTRQEGGNVQLDKDQLGSCNVKLDTDQLGSCNVKPNVKLKTINDLERPTMTAGPEYYDLNYSNVENSEEEVCDNGDNYDEYSEEVVITTEFELSEAEVIRPNEQGRQQAQAEKLKAAIAKARDLVWCKMYESGSPGMIVAISVNGKQVWQHGFGYSDLENKLLAGTGCVMRIASISKPLTMAVLAKLWEEGKVDLDSPLSKYVPDWPKKVVNGKDVEITVRQLCCHMSGVRHYARKNEDEVEEFDMKEYFLKDTFSTTDDSVKLFEDDDLLSAPGEKFNYTTHGFTLLAKVIENVTGQPFDKYMEQQFASLGLLNTYLDKASPIIYNRSKYYVRDEHHRLKNAPYVDNSYKWAGGGFLSNVGDLVKFGNAMLYSYQQKNGEQKKPESTAKLPDVVPKPPETKTEEVQPINPKTPESPLPKIEETPPEDPDTNPETEDLKSAPKAKTIEHSSGLTNVVYTPGPFSSVNKSPSPPIRYLPGYLKSSTMAELWKPQVGANLKWGGDDLVYGLGWAVRQRKKNYGFCLDHQHYVSHTGGAIGASSVLLVAPQPVQEGVRLPQGVVVAILCNMQGVGLNKLAADLAKTFQGFDQEKQVKVQKVYQC